MVSPRSTIQESMGAAMRHGRYRCTRNVKLGEGLGGKREKADFVAERDGTRVIVSLMTKYETGTSDEKVPFEVLSLAKVVRAHESEFSRAYLVLAGEHSGLMDFYLSQGLGPYLRVGRNVKIVSLDGFIKRAGEGRL